jgi:hypothetical protein
MVAVNYQNSLPSRAALGAETPAGKDVLLRPSKNNAKFSPVKRRGNEYGSFPLFVVQLENLKRRYPSRGVIARLFHPHQ